MYWPFDMGDGNLIREPNRPADEQHNVTRANQHYVAAFQAKACVDNRAARVQRKFISFNVLAFITGRRNADVQGAGLARRLAGFVNGSGGCASEKDYITTRDRSAQSSLSRAA